jgi:hypothetical protein
MVHSPSYPRPQHNKLVVYTRCSEQAVYMTCQCTAAQLLLSTSVLIVLHGTMDTSRQSSGSNILPVASILWYLSFYIHPLASTLLHPSLVAGIAGSGGSSPASSAANTALLQAAKGLLAALTAADPALDNPPAAAAAAGPLYPGSEPWDPAAAAAAPRDSMVLPQQHRSSASGRHREGRGSGYGGPSSGRAYDAAGGDDWDEGSGYGVQHDHHHPSGCTDRRGRVLPPRRGGRFARSHGPTAAAAAETGDGRHNNLFTLLAALEQQEQQDSGACAGGMAADDGDSCGAAADTAGDGAAAAAAAAPWDGAYSGYGNADSSGDDSDDGYSYDDAYEADYEEGGHARGGRTGGHARQSYGGNLSPTRRPRGRPKRASSSAAAAAPEPPTMHALGDQAWLLQQRPSGKRPVKPNTEFLAYVAPLLPQELVAHEKKAKGVHTHRIDNLRAYRQSLMDAKSARAAPHKAGPSAAAAAAAAAQAKGFIDGPNYPRRHLKRQRTSWGWYLLGKGRLQQQQQQDEDGLDAAVGGSDEAVDPADVSAAPEHSGSNGGQAAALQAADAGTSGYAGGAAAGGLEGTWGDAGAGEPMAFESMSQAAEAAAAAGAGMPQADQDLSDDGEEHTTKSGVTGTVTTGAAARSPAAAAAGGSAVGGSAAAAAAAAAGGSGGVSELPGKRHRWVAGTNQWVMEDGVVIWPRVSHA